MQEDLSTALLVMGVGMITVFIILSMVVFTGRALIFLVNKYSPEKEKFRSPAYHIPIKKAGLEKKKLAAIVAAVEVATRGKGMIDNIERVQR